MPMRSTVPRALRIAFLCGVCWLPARAESVARGADAPPSATPGASIDFDREIRPILAEHCFKCHGPKRQESGLKLSARQTALHGGDSGEKAIVPGKPDESRLIKVVSGTDSEFSMPPQEAGKPLSPAEIELLVRWIREGATWPDSANDAESRPSHWAWQKPVRPPLPPVKRSDWPRNGIDTFVLARLEREGLEPSPEADRYTLARRVYLDLIGLPPSPGELAAFIADTRPDAYERLVDRVLADPGYGERWARVWLDLARYADSKGYGSDPLRTIWRYRDWVIDAFNRNVPYDRFTIEQIAGDLLPRSPHGPDEAELERLIATAFHRNTMSNDEGGTDDEEFRVAAIKDRVDTTAQIWMGLTLGCAKCHSHKFDPITQREYYEFFAFFNQTEDADRSDEQPLIATPTPSQRTATDRARAEIARLRQELEAPAPELADAQTRWEQEAAAQERAWSPLETENPRSAKGTRFQKLPDRSLLAEGPPPDADTYTIDAPRTPQRITALRLELLPHETLPRGGPGRQPGDGGFSLNEFRVAVSRPEQKPAAGRYVRIELSGAQKILSLAEVQAFAGGENLALHGKASQSSTDYDAPAERAIDNKTGGDFFQEKSVTHTKTEDNPWWECDLGDVKGIDRIVVWNRTDNNLQHRLANFRIAVLGSDRQPVWERTIAEPPNPKLEIGTGGPVAVALKNASSDSDQEGRPVAKAIDGDPGPNSGWSPAAAAGTPHTAVFETASAVNLEDGATLTFTLEQSRGSAQTIGRLRLSATDASPPPRALPGAVRDALAVAAADRNADQQATLARYYRSIAPELEDLRKRIAQAEQQLQMIEKEIPKTPIMRELPPDQRRVTNVLIKSNFLAKGDAVEPAVPVALHPLPGGAPADRLGLAEWLIDKDNPLTARVAVNRFWSRLFGTGLVETEEDFGTQGLPPSHPELLDWLAVEFMEPSAPERGHGERTVGPHAWDIKQALRLIVTSAAYRQSSSLTAELLQKDPGNRLIARGPRYRLEAEMVRDQALALAGLLSRKIGGPSVFPPQPDGLWRAAFNGERTWATSKGEDRYRRGLYTFWRRTVPYPSLSTFDAPSREICMMRRVSTNTPLQAFVTLNDPVYVEAAQALARRIVREGGASPEERARYGLRLCLVRPPQDAQVHELCALYDSELARYRGDSAAAEQIATDPLGALRDGADAAELAAWTVAANVLLNMDGVLTLH